MPKQHFTAIYAGGLTACGYVAYIRDMAKPRESTPSPDPSQASQDAQGEAIAPNMTPSPLNGQAPPLATRWKPGVSFNPGGVPKGKRVSTRMAEMMTWTRADLDALLDDPGAELRDVLAARAIRRAMRDEDAHQDMSLLMDRTEGKVAQELNVRAESRTQLTDEQLAGIAAGTLDPAKLIDLGPRVTGADEPGI